jgi:hypothetical protein
MRLARLPDAVRPGDWRHVLARQAEALDRTDGIPELDEAVTLLGYEDAS